MLSLPPPLLCPVLFAGSLVGSGHPGQGERRSGSDRCRGGRRWAGLPRADESHDGGAWPEKRPAEGGHPWWKTRPGAEYQHPTLPVRAFFLICCIITTTCWWYFGHFIKISTVHPQCVWKCRQSGGSGSGHAAANTRPAALLCKYLLTFSWVPQRLWGGFSLIVLLFPSGLLYFGPKRLQCDGVERQTGLQGRAARSPQQGTGEFIKQLYFIVCHYSWRFFFLQASQSLRVIKDTPDLFYQGFIKAKNYPSSTRVEVMTEGGESAMFKQLFQSWRDKEQTQGFGTTYSVGKIGKLHNKTPLSPHPHTDGTKVSAFLCGALQQNRLLLHGYIIHYSWNICV